jgi:Asp-tRNA(Asn)/Glu-tRNA(Gln) amidotransferase A subunit family amidase/uncharacterized protein YjbI with pentapeptide repeats
MKSATLFLGVILLLAANTARADIYRWDNGQVIPGTEGIELGPGVQLVQRELEYAQLQVGSSPNDLSDSDFRFSDLSNARFIFCGGECVSSNLTRANLTEAILWYAVLNRTKLSDANFNMAVVTGASFYDTTSGGFTKDQLYSTASYQVNNLQGINLGSNDLSGWDLHGQNLANAYLIATMLTNVNLSGAELTNADLSHSTFTNANLSGAIVTGVAFGNATSGGLTRDHLYSTASYQAKNLRGVWLNNNDLTAWDFGGQDLADAYLHESTLTNANLSGANLVNTILGNSTLTNANLAGADMRQSRNANLSGALTRNLIQPNGQVIALGLADGESLCVRDYDGDTRNNPPLPALSIIVRTSISISDGGLLRLIFESDPWDSLISFEPGIPVQLGGTLDLTFADDVEVATQVGRTLRIFDWTGVSPTGTFTVSSPYFWDLSKLYTTGEITVTAVPAIPGDFNSNGVVDTADYVVWRNALGTVFTQDDYNVWRAHFGQPAGMGSIANGAIPEPAGVFLVMIGVCVLLLRLLSRRELRRSAFVALLSSLFATAASAQPGKFTLSEATVADINRAFDEGVLTSERLVQLYLNRIAAYDDAGPVLNTMITLNPAALDTARALDAERRATGPRSPLHGVPVVIKDSLDVFGLPTTFGARALRDSYPPDDAFIVRKLRDAGAVILGKTNLDEFACCSITLSSLGGRTLNPYALSRVVGGSSGGTAAAIAANFAVVGTGSDWWGSIQEPASLNGVVGLMPTRSLISGDGSLHLWEQRGVIGPIARTVADAAAMLDVIVGVDPADPVTAASAGKIPESYLDSLEVDGLRGARIGLVQNFLPITSGPRTLVNAAVDKMRSLGAEIVNVQLAAPGTVASLYVEFEYAANRYLESLGPNARFKNVRELVASGEILPYVQGLAQDLNGDIRPQDDPKYAPIVAERNAFEAQVLALMDSNQLDALIYPPLLSTPPPISTAQPVWETANDLRNLNPSPFLGFPSLTLPIGVLQISASESVPYGIEFLGRPFSEPTLIKLAYSFEQGTQHRVPPASTPPLPGETVPEPNAPLILISGILYLAVARRRPRRH